MQLAKLHGECSVDQVDGYIRAHIGRGSTAQVEECYRTLASIALQHKFDRVLVVGLGAGEPHAHLAARDIVIAFSVIGVPAGFKLAFVPTTDATRNGYRHAEIEASKRGLRAKVFGSEEEAVDWLTQPDVH
ncbi:MAG TPA: hypothetical protein VIV54_17325 [Burkholderiales bacterium]